MLPHQRFPIEDKSQVGEARRAGQMLALEQSFDEEAAGRLALAVTELGTNLMRHVGPNKEAALLIAKVGASIEVLSVDKGPGMDLARCLQDGFSTGGTSGTGLGAVRRMAERFSGFSAPDRGTVLAARFGAKLERTPAAVSAPEPFDIAGVTLAYPGETVSGDAWAIRRDGDRWTVMVADGLGHGLYAAEAADKMCDLLASAPPSSPAPFLERCHEPMRMTRGAAVAAVGLDLAAARFLFAGAGNIAGRLISGVTDRSLMSQHGTLGVQVRRLQDVTYDWPDHAILVLHSDGVITRWNLQDTPGLLQADPSVIAGWIIRDHLRGRDDATVVVIRRH